MASAFQKALERRHHDRTHDANGMPHRTPLMALVSRVLNPLLAEADREASSKLREAEQERRLRNAASALASVEQHQQQLPSDEAAMSHTLYTAHRSVSYEATPLRTSSSSSSAVAEQPGQR